MSNYKLTTDLIADCMALIPQNLKRLNEKAKYFKFEFQNNEPLFIYDLENNYKCYFQYLKFNYGVSIISHCLRTIPEFQEKSNKFWQLDKEIRELEENLRYPSISGKWEEIVNFEKNPQIRDLYYTNVNISIVIDFYKKQIYELFKTETIKEIYSKKRERGKNATIASATLHGQGEYPPSTLEELCESYKNVMSK